MCRFRTFREMMVSNRWFPGILGLLQIKAGYLDKLLSVLSFFLILSSPFTILMTSISYIQHICHLNCYFETGFLVQLPYISSVLMSINLSAPVKNELISDSQFLKYLEISTQSIEMWWKSHFLDKANFPMSGLFSTIGLFSKMFTGNSTKGVGISLLFFSPLNSLHTYI